MQRTLIRHGIIVVLLGSLSGLVPMAASNPRMGVAAHLAGLLYGLLILGLGTAWGCVTLAPFQERLAIGLLLWTAYVGWGVTLAAALTGAKSIAPVAGAASSGASPLVETATLLIGATVFLSALVGLGLALSGTGKK